MDKREMNQRQIGNVVLDYTYFSTTAKYSDGDIEDILLEAAKNNKMEELLHISNDWAVLYHCSNIRENLLEWYPFKKEGTLLEIGSGCGALTGLFSRKVNAVTCIELSERRSMINAYRNRDCDNVRIMLGNFEDVKIEEKFDYITLIGVWEYAGLYIHGENPYYEMLNILKKYLKEDGKILIAIENKMGLKYWNGAVEDHTGKRYSGMNDYVDDKQAVCTFSRPEIEKLLKDVGIESYKFYYPMPDYKLPSVIFSDGRLPQPGELRQYREDYNAPRVYNFYDATIQDQLCNDQMISYFSNSFLIECGTDLSNVLFAKYDRKRKDAFAISTVIYTENEKKKVKKTALSSLAQAHVENCVKNTDYCASKLYKVQARVEEGSCVVDYIEGQDLESMMYQYRHSPELFTNKVKEILSTYLLPEEDELYPFTMTERYKEIFGENIPANATSLSHTNIDLLFSNLRVGIDEKVYCIDSEWVFDFPVPYEYALWRSVSQLYTKYMIYLKNKISRNEFLVEVGLNKENLSIYQDMEKSFAKTVCNMNYLKQYRMPVMTYDMKLLK